MRATNFLLGVSILAKTAFAHMQLYHPPPFNASNNPHRSTLPDPYLQFPYDCCGPHDRWMYPCRGYLSLLGTDQGAPTATWEAGSNQTWSIKGIGNHYGGSCQVGFLDDSNPAGHDGHHDEENAFRVATSYEGNCPHRNGGDGPDGQEFEFTVPRDLDAGVRVFAWIWYNREQEFNMNCAAVNITAPGAVTGNGKGAEGENNRNGNSPAISHMSSSVDSTTTIFTTIHKTSTTMTTTTITPSQTSVGSDAGPNPSLATAASPSSSTDWARFGEGFNPSSSDATTTVYTTVSSSPSRAISTTLTGLSALASQLTSAGPSVSSSDPSLGLAQDGGTPAASSAEETTTVYTTITTTPPETMSAALTGLSALAPQNATGIGEASVPSSATSLPFSNNSDVFYTSTTTTVMEIVTTTVPAPTSTSAAPDVFAPAAANMTQTKVQTFRTANNCSCTCPADNSSNIEDCVCFCYQPLSRVPSRNSTTLVDAQMGIAMSDSSGNNDEDVPRPDDLIMHPRGLDKIETHNQSSDTSDASRKFVPFHSRPLMLIADDGNGCLTPKTNAELKYPDPGPDIVPGDHAYPLELPSGNCSSPGEQRYHGETGNDGHM